MKRVVSIALVAAIGATSLALVAPPAASAAGEVASPAVNATPPSPAAILQSSTYRDLVIADGAVAYWRLGESSGTTAFDEVAPVRHGVYGGNANLNRSQPGALAGDSDTSVRFIDSGLNGGEVRVPTAAKLKTPEASVEVWFRVTEPTEPTMTLYSQGLNGSNFHLYLNAAGQPRAQVLRFNGTSTATVQVSSNVVLADGEWHHAILSVGDGAARLIVDGQLLASTPMATAIAWRTNNNDVFFIGTRLVGLGDASYFNGWIDEVAHYNRAITPAEARAHYRASGRRPPPVEGGLASLFGQGFWSGIFGRILAADPVEPVSGNFLHEEADLAFPASSSLRWARTYNSRDTSVGVLGTGWSTPIDAGVSVDGDGVAHVRLFDGQVLAFGPEGGGSWTRPFRYEADLTGDGTGDWVLTTGDGASTTFDAAGRVTGWSNGHSSSVAVDWSGGLAVTLASSEGHVLELSYGAGNELVAVLASDGRAVEYDWQAGRVVEMTAPNDSTTSYGYDAAARLATITDGGGVLLVSNGYDSDGRVTTQAEPGRGSATFAYDETNQRTVVENVETGEMTIYLWGLGGEVVGVVDPLAETSTREVNVYGQVEAATDRAGATVEVDYDLRGNVVAQVSPSGQQTTFAYDQQDRLVTTTAPDGGITTYTYAGDERVPATITDPEGGVALQTVVDGLVLERTDPDGVAIVFTYDAQRRLASMADELSGVTMYGYDVAGRVTSAVSPEGAEQSWLYDDAGWLLSETAPDGGVTSYTYDGAGRLLTTTDPANAVTTNTYDAFGRLETVIDPASEVTTYTYDALGQVVAVTEPGGAVTTNVWGPLGRLLSTTDPEGVTTTFDYDEAGRQVMVTTPAGTSETRFDAAGRMVEREDPLGRITAYGYDVMDRVSQVTDPAGGVSSFGFDLASRQVTVADPVGGVSQTAYTPAGREAVTTDPTGVTTSFRYDDAGRQVGVADGASNETVTMLDGDGRALSVTTSEGRTTAYSYDVAGRPLTETDGEGVTTSRTWSTRGELLTEQRTGQGVVSFVYDAVGRVASVTDALGATTTYAYDGRGNQTVMTDAADKDWTSEWDLADRLVSEADPLLGTTTHSYDAAGRLAGTMDPTGRTVDNTWDAAGQLTSVLYAGTETVSFTYDAAGRRTSMTDASGLTTWTWDLAGRMLSETTPDGDVVTNGYDLSGRRTSLEAPNQAVDYAYDARGLLASLDAGPGGVTAFEWDGDGLLTEEDGPGAALRAWGRDDAGRPWAYYDTNGPSTEFVYRSYDTSGRPFEDQWTDGRFAAYGYDQAGQLAAELSTARGLQTWAYDERGSRIQECSNLDCTTHTYDAAARRLSSTAANASAAGYSTEVAADDPIGYWRAGESTGTVASDETTAGNDGAYQNVALGLPGAIAEDSDTAVRLDPTSAIALPTPDVSTSTGEATSIEMWVRPTGPDASYLFSSGNVSATTVDGNVYLLAGAGWRAAPGVLTEGTWHHLVFVIVDGDLSDASLWVDGRLVPLESAGVPSAPSLGTSMTVGGVGTTGVSGFPGDIDEIAVYPARLTAPRIAVHYRTGLGERTYTYDTAGRTLTDTTHQHTQAIAYDASGLLATLAEAISDDTWTQTRTYDGTARLAEVATTSPTGAPAANDLTWDSATSVPRLLELDDQPLTWGPSGLLADDGDPIVRDIDSSITAGSRAASDGYDPWGVGGGLVTADALALGYRGELVLGNDLHLRNRDYQPGTGQFTTADPLAGVNGTTTIANPYHYANNAPFVFTDPLGLRATDGDFGIDLPPGDCRWEDAVVDAYVTPSHSPGTPSNPRCRSVVDDYISAVIVHPDTWDAEDGFRKCANRQWAISVRVVPYARGSQTFAVLQVEPSGWARWSAYIDRVDGGDQPWRSTWQCAKEAMAEVSEPTVYGTKGSYGSQYYCHAFGSIGIPGTDRWLGGPTWDLEGWRAELWNKQTWVRTRCNW